MTRKKPRSRSRSASGLGVSEPQHKHVHPSSRALPSLWPMACWNIRDISSLDGSSCFSFFFALCFRSTWVDRGKGVRRGDFCYGSRPRHGSYGAGTKRGKRDSLLCPQTQGVRRDRCCNTTNPWSYLFREPSNSKNRAGTGSGKTSFRITRAREVTFHLTCSDPLQTDGRRRGLIRTRLPVSLGLASVP